MSEADSKPIFSLGRRESDGLPPESFERFQDSVGRALWENNAGSLERHIRRLRKRGVQITYNPNQPSFRFADRIRSGQGRGASEVGDIIALEVSQELRGIESAGAVVLWNRLPLIPDLSQIDPQLRPENLRPQTPPAISLTPQMAQTGNIDKVASPHERSTPALKRLALQQLKEQIIRGGPRKYMGGLPQNPTKEIRREEPIIERKQLVIVVRDITGSTDADYTEYMQRGITRQLSRYYDDIYGRKADVHYLLAGDMAKLAALHLDRKVGNWPLLEVTEEEMMQLEPSGKGSLREMFGGIGKYVRGLVQLKEAQENVDVNIVFLTDGQFSDEDVERANPEFVFLAHEGYRLTFVGVHDRQNQEFTTCEDNFNLLHQAFDSIQAVTIAGPKDVVSAMQTIVGNTSKRH